MCFQCFPFFSRSNPSPPSSPRPSQVVSPPNSSSCAESAPLLEPCHTVTIVSSLESDTQQHGSYTPPSEVLTEISEQVKIVAAGSSGLSDVYETPPAEECDISMPPSSTPEPITSQVHQLAPVEHTQYVPPSMTISHSEGNTQDVLDQPYEISYSPSSSPDQTPSSQLDDEYLKIEEGKPPQYEGHSASSSPPKHTHKHRHRIGQHLHGLQQHVKEEGNRHFHSLYNGAKQQVSEICASLSAPHL